ncbi:MAG TPA: hypothetical protein VFA56_08330 [Gaiellaceae bacterium]|nr:hypothetical protein [Gaiellaceae bacterium]
MLLYGLLDHSVAEVVEIYPTLDDAQAALDDCLRDEPEWHTILEVVALEYPVSAN